MIRYIYITTNTLNNIKYIGQRKCPKNKTPENDTYLGSGIRLLRAINKYGKEYFTKEIIHICNSQKESDEFEINFIKENNVLGNKDKWYNIDAGGQYNRSEKHSELTSNSMKKYYSTLEGRNALIIGKNKALIKKGLKPLPYNNYNEYLIYKLLPKIVKANKRKLKKIKSLKHKSSKSVKALPDYISYKMKKTQQSSMKPESLNKRKQSQHNAWDKRKQSMKDNWTQEAKKAFALGKAIQHNNNMLIQLINSGVPTWDKSIKSLLHSYRNRINIGYKDETNKLLQANKIVDAIRTNYNINVDISIILNT